MSNENDSETFLAELLRKRLMFVEATRANDFSEGISRLLSELYPDEAHFIYELLQNAEDACATKVEFCLKPDRLLVTHNGTRLEWPLIKVAIFSGSAFPIPAAMRDFYELAAWSVE